MSIRHQSPKISPKEPSTYPAVSEKNADHLQGFSSNVNLSGSKRKTSLSDDQKNSRQWRLNTLRAAQKLLWDWNVAQGRETNEDGSYTFNDWELKPTLGCLRWRQSKKCDVIAYRGITQDGDIVGRLGNMQTSRAYVDPYGAMVKARTNQALINALVQAAEDQGLHAAMMTFTHAHEPGVKLATYLDLVHRSWSAMTQKDGTRELSRGWESFKDYYGYVGYVLAPAETYNYGWHHHYHVVLFTEKPLDHVARDAVAALWRVSLKLHGLWASIDYGVKLSTKADEIGEYVGVNTAGWGLSEEMTLDTYKVGEGVHPFGLLESWMDTGDQKAGDLYVEWATTIYNTKNRYRVSPGLYKRLGVNREAVIEAAEAEFKYVSKEYVAMLLEEVVDQVAKDYGTHELEEAIKTGDQLIIWGKLSSMGTELTRETWEDLIAACQLATDYWLDQGLPEMFMVLMPDSDYVDDERSPNAPQEPGQLDLGL